MYCKEFWFSEEDSYILAPGTLARETPSFSCFVSYLQNYDTLFHLALISLVLQLLYKILVR